MYRFIDLVFLTFFQIYKQKNKVNICSSSKREQNKERENFFRGEAIDIVKLLAVIQIRTKPIMFDTIDAIMMQYLLDFTVFT